MPVRVLLEMFESMGRIWAQMLISMNVSMYVFVAFFLAILSSHFVLSIPSWNNTVHDG